MHTFPCYPAQAVTEYLEKVAIQYENGLPTFNVQRSAFVMPLRLDERVELEVRRKLTLTEGLKVSLLLCLFRCVSVCFAAARFAVCRIRFLW